MVPPLNCILLLDDDEGVSFFNKTLINEEDCCSCIIEKASVATAIKYLLESANDTSNLPFPDLIFSDIQMPAWDGWDFLDQFRQIKEKFAAKPIIYMLSSAASNQDVLKVASYKDLAGIYEKPLTPELLKSILLKHFICV